MISSGHAGPAEVCGVQKIEAKDSTERSRKAAFVTGQGKTAQPGRCEFRPAEAEGESGDVHADFLRTTTNHSVGELARLFATERTSTFSTSSAQAQGEEWYQPP